MFTLAQAFVRSQSPRRGPRIAIVNGHEAIAGEVLVRYRTTSGSIERRRAEFDVEADEVEPVGRRGARRLRSRRLETSALLQRLAANPDVEFVEPNYLVRLDSTPYDPSFAQLWGLFNNGQVMLGNSGIAGDDIGATNAWEITTGSRDNVVGVIDTGIDYGHQDLAANVWTAPRAFSVVIGGVSITCAAGTHGFNAITNTCDPFDDHSHGTHVAGTIGAVGNNGLGITGVNWTASLMGLKFLSSAGSGSTSDAIKAIEFAIQAKMALGEDANVRILSNSWGGGAYSTALHSQIEAANDADMLFVAAAGNNASNNDVAPQYPSSYPGANVISVAATTNRDQRAAFSNWGTNSVDLGAPGQGILSTVPNNGYAYYNGTSMAAPHVSGVAALVLATCPRTTAGLRETLLTTVDSIAALGGLTTTGGRLNAYAAVRSCLEPPAALAMTAAGGTLSVAVSNAPGNARDWVGLYCPASSGHGSRTAWKYLNDATSAPATGATHATITFPAPAGPTTCNARLFLNNGFTLLAISNTVTSPSAPIVAPTVSLTNLSETGEAPPEVAPGGTIEIAVSAGPANQFDWVGLFEIAAPDTAYTQWFYLNGSRIAPSSGMAGASVRFTAPAIGGTYEVRFFTNNGFTKLAASAPIRVCPCITVPSSVAPGAPIVFSVTHGPANPKDWVGLYNTGTSDTAWTAWNYLSGSKTALTAGASSATLQFIAPATPGTYNIRFFADDEFTRLATSATITVGPTLTVASTIVASGAPITVIVSGGPANRKDWVGLFASNATDTAFVTWMYLSGSKSAPAGGLDGATLQFTAPSPGTYTLRLFSDDGFTRLATSALITVVP